jgi:glycerophosphoryl diester phosphodiesterase
MKDSFWTFLSSSRYEYAARYYLELGVDVIITDYPDVLKSVVEAYFGSKGTQ